MSQKLSISEYQALLASGAARFPGSARKRGERRRETKATEETLTSKFTRMLALGWPDSPPLLPQYRWAQPERQFRADFAHPASHVLIELEGGVFTGGAHGSVEGQLRDVERSQWAAALGWRVFRLTTKDLDERPAQCIELLRRAIQHDKLQSF